MITRENLSWAFDNLTEEEINNVFESEHDQMTFEVHSTNVGSYAQIESIDCNYDEEEYMDVMILDKDAFLQLFTESDSVNPFITALL